MAEIDERVITTQNGVVDTDAEYEELFERVKTDEEVRDIILEFVKDLDGEIEVHKAILVGRYAKGCAWGGDDIKVAIVSPDFKGLHGFERSDLVFDNIDIYKLHPLVVVHGHFTPDEFLNGQIESLYGWNWRGGKVIYERDAG